jgi:hypothetical protein
MGKSENEKTEDVGKATKKAAAPPADHQESQSGGATPYTHPAVEGAVPGEQVMASGEVKDPPSAAHPAPEPAKTPTVPPQTPPVVEKAKPVITERKPSGPQCPKCGSTSIGMAGGMRRCNQCSNSF